MTADRLAVIVPTRSRPHNIPRLVEAWDFTGAWQHADLILVIDADDPRHFDYIDMIDVALERPDRDITVWTRTTREMLVPKLNRAALEIVERASGVYAAIGFAGDDHVPRTIGWADAYLSALAEPGVWMVHGDDGIQGATLATEWAVRTEGVATLGAMVPVEGLEHLYCDNAMMDVYGGAGLLRHLPAVRIEHMHPVGNTAPNDPQYVEMNSGSQYGRDRMAYRRWRQEAMPGLVDRLSAAAGAPEASPRRGARPGASASRALPDEILRNLAGVTGATPDEIGGELYHLATQVPAHEAIVELGVYHGRTLLSMAYGARAGHRPSLWGFDLWEREDNTYDAPFKTPSPRKHALWHLRRLGFRRDVTLTQTSTLEAAAAWSGPQVGLLFIDAGHTYEEATADVLAWLPHLAEGAVIAVDDYGHPDYPDVRRAIDDLSTEGVLGPVRQVHGRLALTSAAIAERPPLVEVTLTASPPEPEAPTITITHAETSLDIAPDTLDLLNVVELRTLARQRGVTVSAVARRTRAGIIEALRDAGVTEP